MPTDDDVGSSRASTQDPELAAMQAIVTALSPLNDESRSRVLDYVFRRIGIPNPTLRDVPPPLVTPRQPAEGQTRDIRSLAEDKKPSSAIERATLVAYYLSELAAEDHKKTEIGSDDLKQYFKQAGFPIVREPHKVLNNAKAAGYLDSGSGRGTYKLNPVGHNLIVHGFGGAKVKQSRAKSSRKAAKKRGGGKAKRR